MKNSKLFKRSLLLLAVVALAVVLTIGIVAGAATISEGDADYGERYAGVQVGTSGKVSLKFYYSTTGTAEKFVAEVTDPDTNETETQYFAVADLENTGNGYCVPVALAPSQMTHTVKIYADGTDGAGKAYVYSVKKYAQDVIADTKLADYHDAMRALLNWGAMAQGYFGDATGTLANADVYARGTNPINAVKEIVAGDATVANGTAITADKYALSLEQNNLAIHFYVNYAGDASQLTATVEREGRAAVSTSVEATGTKGIYRIRVANVNAALFATPYTVKVSADNDTCTITASVLNNLASLVKANGEEAATAKAMYQFYQNVVDGAVSANCAHEASIYWLSNGDGTDSYRCSACFTDYARVQVPESVTLYYSPYEFATTAKRYVNGACSFNLTDGVYATSNGNQEIHWARNHEDQNAQDASLDATIEVGNAKYFVIKVKSTDTDAKLSLRISTPGKSGDGNNRGYIPAHIWKGNETKTGEWTTYVIDLEKVYDGYYIKNEGKNTYTLDTYFYGCGGVFDVAYVAFVEDNWSAIKTLTGENEVTKIINANGDSMQVNTTDGGCAAGHGNITETLTDDACTYKCGTCGIVLKTITLTDGVKVFYSAYNMSTPVASATDNKLTPNTHFNMDSKAFKFEDGTPHFTFKGTGSTFQLIWMRDTGSASGHERYCVDMGQARYMVIKARGTDNNNAINNVRVNFNTAGSTAAVATFKLPLNAAGADKWGVYVIDMSTVLSDNYKKSDDTGTYELDCFYIVSNGSLAKTETIDIGYVAFVEDDWSAIKTLTGENEVTKITDTNGNSVQVNTIDGGCAAGHGNITETLTDDACTYKCGTCGVVLKTITLTDGVEVFYSAYNMSTPVASATPDKLTPNTHVNMGSKAFKFEDGTPFFTFTGTGKNFQLTWMRDTSKDDHEKYYVDMGQAKYMVIKARGTGTANVLNNVRVHFNTAGSTASSGDRFKLPLNAAGTGEWGVYVIDMSKVLSSYYEKSEGTYKLKCFYIEINGNLETTEKIDIGYVAFVDDWTDIDSIVDEKTVYNVTSTGGACSIAELNN